MADEKKKPSPKKEAKTEADAKPEAAAKAGSKQTGDGAPAKGKKAPAASGDGQPAATEGAKLAEGAPVAGMAAAAPTAAELLADEFARKNLVKAKGAKNIITGVANILATFNNTLVSITDMQGHVIGWSSAGRVGFKGSRKSTAYAAQQVPPDAARPAMSHGIPQTQIRVKVPAPSHQSALTAFPT